MDRMNISQKIWSIYAVNYECIIFYFTKLFLVQFVQVVQFADGCSNDEIGLPFNHTAKFDSSWPGVSEEGDTAMITCPPGFQLFNADFRFVWKRISVLFRWLSVVMYQYSIVVCSFEIKVWVFEDFRLSLLE